MADKNDVLINTKLPLPPFVKGKVRDTYDLGKHLLIIATDRLSALLEPALAARGVSPRVYETESEARAGLAGDDAS